MREFSDVQNEFDRLGVSTQSVEFYNLPEFIRAEQSNPALLESYAEYVAANPYDELYMARARRVIPLVCGFLHRELLEDSKLGACLDFVQTTMKILEQLDIWCVAMCGSLTVEFDAQLNQRNRHWAHVFQTPEGHNAAGHAWLLAPPFQVIDMTIGRQQNTEGVQHFLPATVMSEETESVTPYPHRCDGGFSARRVDSPYAVRLTTILPDGDEGMVLLYPKAHFFCARDSFVCVGDLSCPLTASMASILEPSKCRRNLR